MPVLLTVLPVVSVVVPTETTRISTGAFPSRIGAAAARPRLVASAWSIAAAALPLLVTLLVVA